MHCDDIDSRCPTTSAIIADHNSLVSEPEVAIRVQHLTKAYRLYNNQLDRLKEVLHPLGRKYHHDFLAVSDVSFEIKKGETVGIVGKNGSGKSTLLKLIAGVLTPTSGEVKVNGQVSTLLELGAGFNPELTGIENVYFNGALMGYSREEMSLKLDDILKFADIGDFVHQPVRSYSSGMFIRLAFSVAINVDPKILIVDEALSVGDALFSAKCMSVIERYRERGTSILFVSHDINSIKSLCSRAIYLKKGQIDEIGAAGVIADKYMKELREECDVSMQRNNIRKINTEIMVPREENASGGIENNPSLNFKYDNEFEQRTSFTRYGTGEVKITGIELLDISYKPIAHIMFNDTLILLIYVECIDECTFSVNYNIRDAYNVNILGSNFRIENNQLIDGKIHDKYIVEYRTKIPLASGNYNINISVTEPNILNQSAKFIDVVDSASVFTVLERPIAKLWSKVYVNNELKVYKV